MALDAPIFGEGIYRPREAARLIGATPQEVLRWTRGSGPIAPIWKAHYQFLNDATEISFLDLIELRAVRGLRQNGISIQAIRYAINLAKGKFGIERPLSAVAFKTDGPEILMDAVERDGELVSLSRNRPTQKVFRKIVDQYSIRPGVRTVAPCAVAAGNRGTRCCRPGTGIWRAIGR